MIGSHDSVAIYASGGRGACGVAPDSEKPHEKARDHVPGQG